MKEIVVSQMRVADKTSLCCSDNPPQRILVVDDEPSVLHANVKILAAAGYHVESAVDGAAAWDTLQVKNYDLVVTDNNMPKVTGVELIGNIRASGMKLPVILATGLIPEHEFSRRPELQPEAILLKPYSIPQFLGAVRTVLCAIITFVLLLSAIAPVNAEDIGNSAPTAPVVTRPNAATLSVHGKCDYSQDGITFTNLDRGTVLYEGAVIRTGEAARADLFFRRTGTSVRLQANTEVKLEKMTLDIKDGLPIEHTLLDLRTGRIFTVVRSKIVGNTMEIRNAAGRSVVEGSGIGRYIITADGTHVAAIGSVIPLKVINENGITIIAAGQQFARKEGRMLPVSTSVWVKDFLQLDELQAINVQADAQSP